MAKKFYLTIFVGILILVAFVLPAAAQGDRQDEPPGRDPAFEQEIYDRLSAINPEAVYIFQEATQAMDMGDLVSAEIGYLKVLDLAPGFPDAMRRLSYVEMELGDVETALDLAQQALEVQESPYNHIAVAQALLATEDAANYQKALSHARLAVDALPEDDGAYMTLLYAGVMTQNARSIRQASAKLTEIRPDYPPGHFFLGLSAAQEGKWEQAERELLLAQELGMPAEDVQMALDQGIASQARLYRWLRRGGYAVGGWLVGLGVLFLVGVLLSRLTLSTVRQARPSAESRVGWAERLVRTVYRVVILLTSLYFYISIPLVILAVIAAAAGVFYLFLVIGQVPLKFTVFLIVATLYTLIAVVCSLFARVKDEEPGRLLSRIEAPQLWSLAEEVAERVGTRPVDAVYVTPASHIAVAERGGLLQKLRGAGQRCLILGLGALPGMTQGQLRAILAHEYGHFSNLDTAGGNLARRVRASINRMAYGLATSGQARWYNPAWLFVSGFNRIFLRITLGASRLQEILADRYAALAYGVENFVEGLTHIVQQGLTFSVLVNQEIKDALEQGRELQNLYLLPPAQFDLISESFQEKLSDEMTRPTSPYDSHPAVRERVELVRALEVTEEVGGGQDPAWDLLPNAERLQSEMTTVVQESVRKVKAQEH